MAFLLYTRGARDGVVVEALRYKPEGSAGWIPDGVTEIFHWHNPSGRNGPGVDSASNTNEYQEYYQMRVPPAP
jgi:hypothetical protein